MNREDFCIVHFAKAGKCKVICYEITDINCLETYFRECNYKPSILAYKLGMHYQSLRKLLIDSGLWHHVSTLNGKGAGINRSRMRATNKQGYLYSENPDSYDLRDGRSRRKLKHIEVMEKILGRPLNSPSECVHHIDGNKINNAESNLINLNRSEHKKIHSSLERIAFKFIELGLITFDPISKSYIIKGYIDA